MDLASLSLRSVDEHVLEVFGPRGSAPSHSFGTVGLLPLRPKPWSRCGAPAGSGLVGYFLDSFRALSTTLRNVFKKPITVHYPAEKRSRAERYRNTFALLHDEDNEELCVGCLQCERICPSQVITVIAEKRESPVTQKRRGYAKDFSLDLNACIFCELCVQVCPTDAIVMTRLPEEPSYSREDLCLTMDRLYENETKKPATWATASKLMEMQDPKRGQPKPVKKAKAKPKPTKTESNAPASKKPEPKVAKAPGPDADEELRQSTLIDSPAAQRAAERARALVANQAAEPKAKPKAPQEPVTSSSSDGESKT